MADISSGASTPSSISLPDLLDAALAAHELSVLLRSILGKLRAGAPIQQDIATAHAIVWEVLNDLELAVEVAT